MSSDEENEETIIFDTEDGYIKSLEDLAAQSVIDETEIRPEVKHKETLPAAPDGGYAWVICCAVFLNHMIYEGLGRAEGLFFLQFQSRFGATAQMAAWPGSLMSTLRLFLGPVCSAVVNRYSVRTASIMASLLCFTGMLLNGFAPNIYFLFLSHTLLGGLGRSLISGIIILNLYFDKHRSLATGLGISGIGMGSLWTIPLVQYLFDEYGFTGAFVILSGLLLNGLLIAMMYRPLRMHYRFMTAKLLRKGLKTRMNEYDIAVCADTTIDSTISHSSLAETELKQQEKLFRIDENAEQQDKNEPAEAIPLLEETSLDSKNGTLSISSSSSSSDDDKDTLRISEVETAQPESQTKEEKVLVEKKDDSEGCLSSSLKICFPVEFKRGGDTNTPKVFHWELLKHMPFLVYCTSGLLLLLATKIAFVFLPALAMSKGLSRQQAALMLTITGGVDTFARIATGFIMDLRCMRRYKKYFFTSLLYFMALDTIMMPFQTSFTSFSIICALYGFLNGAFMAQRMVFLVDIVGRERMASGLGLQRVFQGVGTLIGPPLAGSHFVVLTDNSPLLVMKEGNPKNHRLARWCLLLQDFDFEIRHIKGALRDALGNYDSSFYLGGSSMIGSSLLMTLAVVLVQLRNRKSEI